MSEQTESNENHSYKQFLRWEQKTPPTTEQEFLVDPRRGLVYLEDAELQLVAEIAIVTGRPLLLSGEPGSGKSSFAPFIARNLNWRYYEFNVTGRTEAKDLLWRFDALRRLRDAQAARQGTKIDSRYYITPGVLWWAFNRTETLQFIRNNKLNNEESKSKKAEDFEPFAEINSTRSTTGAVVLIDEIDKADPNVPNDLLEVIGTNTFTIDETGDVIKRQIPMPKNNPETPSDFGNLLIIITTNEERDLPPAFLRRCIGHNLAEPTDEKDLTDRWIQIARLHAGKNINNHPQGDEMIKKLAEKCWRLREETANEIRRSPSIAEFLDALRTCFRLNITPDSDIWNQVENSVLIKSTQRNIK